MANTLTAVAPVLYSSAVAVPRELIGGLNAFNKDFDDKGVAKGGSVTVSVAPSLTAASVTPSQTFSAGSDRTVSSRSLTLSNFEEVSWNLTAEEEKSLLNSQVAQDVLAQTIQQGFRTLANAVEADAMTTAANSASRAVGTAGTTPFASNLNVLAEAKQILDDNGAGLDRSLIIDTDAEVKLHSLTQLTNANQAGGDGQLRDGSLGSLFGAKIYRSGQVNAHTAGTGSGYLLNDASAAIGDTTIAADTGSGTILEGDVVTIDGHDYVVASALSGGSFTIEDPGLRTAAADNSTITVASAHACNLLVDRGHTVAVARPALQPLGGGIEQMVIQDPTSGISALLLRVAGNAMASWYMRIVYDSFVPNPHAGAKIMG